MIYRRRWAGIAGGPIAALPIAGAYQLIEQLVTGGDGDGDGADGDQHWYRRKRERERQAERDYYQRIAKRREEERVRREERQAVQRATRAAAKLEKQARKQQEQRERREKVAEVDALLLSISQEIAAVAQDIHRETLETDMGDKRNEVLQQLADVANGLSNVVRQMRTAVADVAKMKASHADLKADHESERSSRRDYEERHQIQHDHERAEQNERHDEAEARLSSITKRFDGVIAEMNADGRKQHRGHTDAIAKQAKDLASLAASISASLAKHETQHGQHRTRLTVLEKHMKHEIANKDARNAMIGDLLASVLERHMEQDRAEAEEREREAEHEASRHKIVADMLAEALEDM